MLTYTEKTVTEIHAEFSPESYVQEFIDQYSSIKQGESLIAVGHDVRGLAQIITMENQEKLGGGFTSASSTKYREQLEQFIRNGATTPEEIFETYKEEERVGPTILNAYSKQILALLSTQSHQ